MRLVAYCVERLTKTVLAFQERSEFSCIINEAVKLFVIIRARTSYALSKRLDTRSDEVHAYLAKQALRLHNQSSLAALYGAYYD